MAAGFLIGHHRRPDSHRIEIGSGVVEQACRLGI